MVVREPDAQEKTVKSGHCSTVSSARFALSAVQGFKNLKPQSSLRAQRKRKRCGSGRRALFPLSAISALSAVQGFENLKPQSSLRAQRKRKRCGSGDALCVPSLRSLRALRLDFLLNRGVRRRRRQMRTVRSRFDIVVNHSLDPIFQHGNVEIDQ